MGKKQREKGLRRRMEAAAKRESIAKEFNNPRVLEVSQPNHLGRAMFASRKEMRQYVGAGGQIPDYLTKPKPGIVSDNPSEPDHHVENAVNEMARDMGVPSPLEPK